MIVASLPIILITSIFLGFEAPFYYSISLLGLSLWRWGGEERLKKSGIIICMVGTILFSITFVYYLVEGIIFPDKPFEFKTISLIFKSLSG